MFTVFNTVLPSIAAQYLKVWLYHRLFTPSLVEGIWINYNLDYCEQAL